MGVRASRAKAASHDLMRNAAWREVTLSEARQPQVPSQRLAIVTPWASLYVFSEHYGYGVLFTVLTRLGRRLLTTLFSRLPVPVSSFFVVRTQIPRTVEPSGGSFKIVLPPISHRKSVIPAGKISNAPLSQPVRPLRGGCFQHLDAETIRERFLVSNILTAFEDVAARGDQMMRYLVGQRPNNAKRRYGGPPKQRRNGPVNRCGVQDDKRWILFRARFIPTINNRRTKFGLKEVGPIAWARCFRYFPHLALDHDWA